MARLGLAPYFNVTFANDFNPAKAVAYTAAFGDHAVRVGDVWALTPKALPGRATLAWASFPCQDLSLAGPRAGLDGARSGAFWGFWRLIEGLAAEGRAPAVLALENVIGLASARGGVDLAALMEAVAKAGYFVGALTLDAADFTPQSRPRLFVVASQAAPPAARVGPAPAGAERIASAAALLSPQAQARFVWWRLPPAPRRNTTLAAILDDPPQGACWHGPEKTARLLSLMAPHQAARVERLIAQGGRHVGAYFARIRTENGVRAQRIEARFDGLAGCLRTPAGGSSRQGLLFVENGRVRSRLLSAREAARLMGLPEDYPLPASQSAALHLIGDGVCVPAVRHLTEHLLAPLAGARRARTA